MCKELKLVKEKYKEVTDKEINLDPKLVRTRNKFVKLTRLIRDLTTQLDKCKAEVLADMKNSCKGKLPDMAYFQRIGVNAEESLSAYFKRLGVDADEAIKSYLDKKGLVVDENILKREKRFEVRLLYKN